MLRSGVALEYGDMEELFDLYDELADKFEPVDPVDPVDGDAEARTSHRAELQGQAALFIMIQLFLQYRH